MADHRNAVDTQEWSPAELRVIDFSLQIEQRLGNERIGQAAKEGSGYLLE
jgi:hypothetical protein